MIYTESFSSSSLDFGTYDTERQELTMTFVGGATYLYSDVPESTWFAILSASSAGAYFASNVRHDYSYRRL